ncbi:ABC transporter ATP-binding protein [Tistrella mobilis]|uniref:ABC transporter ATP-binding protein n=1 Tax=Tistrella mobilis (strain KA081020-065) TaxID=1110502 RepID=I3TXQ0_TISMK|nr:ABC transporter ATP-binding protein [Tistrella mobilis]AFK57538.1 ABC transporter ATP-binding protein [Tistrella mobilis KA081020-065]
MTAVLEMVGVTGGYGPAQVLFGIDLAVHAGEVVALIGRNGMGKSSTIGAALGLVTVTGGRVRVDGTDVTGAAPHRIARAGLGLVPEGRQVFPGLSVHENLVATARPGPWTEARVHELFPRLAERTGQRARLLSGGEQQMLAIGRALLTNPRLLILDEATEGLAPLIRRDIWAALARLKAEGLAILVVDKDLKALARLADRAVGLERGRVAWAGPGAALADTGGAARRLVGV